VFALASVEKFLRDNPDRVGSRAEAILARAKKVSVNGLFHGRAVKDIMDDDELTREFRDVAMSDPEHVRIGLRAMRSSAP